MGGDKWRVATDPQQLFEMAEDRISLRKARLFAVACCRTTLPGLLTFEQERILDVVESHIDHPIGYVLHNRWGLHRLIDTRSEQPKSLDRPDESYAFRGSIFQAVHLSLYTSDLLSYCTGQELRKYGLRPFYPSAFEKPYDFAVLVSMRGATAVVEYLGMKQAPKVSEDLLDRTFRRHADPLRAIVGDPFREVDAEFDRVVRKHPEIKLFAAEIYLSKSFAAANRLAAMLLDAGLDDAEIRREAASPGPFAKGDWLVDRVLGID